MRPANDSSSSGTRADASHLADSVAASLPVLPTALLAGEHRDLLEPLRFLSPGAMPEGPPSTVDRSALARSLATANAAYGHPEAQRLADKLADPSTRVVVTGQQPGLFGGPLLSFAKMAAAVRWAETLQESGVPAIALFWVANEDHDFQETSRTTLLGKAGPVASGLGDDPSPLMPVGMRAFGAPLLDALDQARALYSGEFAEARWQQLARWYRPDARFGEAFFRLMVAALGKRAPLMLDATDPELKKAQRPYLTALVEKRHALLAAQDAAHAAVGARGLPLQVTPQPGASPLFLLRGTERRRILWHGDAHWTLRGGTGEPEPVETLLETIRENPAVVSPGVLARPAMQDAALGTTLQVLGPSEMTYMAQAAAAYRVLDLPAPWTTLRPQTLVLERRQEEQLTSLGLSWKDLEASDTARIIADRLGGDVVTPARTQIAEILAGLEAPIREIDPTLEGPRAKTASQIDRSLEQLTGKVAGALARRHEVWHKRLEAIRAVCWPNGRAQERTLAVAHFMVRHGEALGEAYLDQMMLDPRTIQVIRL